VPMDSPDKRAPTPQEENFGEFIRNAWSNSNTKIYKERIKITFKKPDEKKSIYSLK